MLNVIIKTNFFTAIFDSFLAVILMFPDLQLLL
jgi:hypothetical protein